MSLKSRVERLEKIEAQSEYSNRDWDAWRAERRQKRFLEALDRLSMVVDREHWETMLVHLQDGEPTGFRELILQIELGQWQPIFLPQEVVDVFLEDRLAMPFNWCESCSIPLPMRAGFWRCADKPRSFWQAHLDYWKSCPHCGGVIVSMGTREPVEDKNYLPPRPNEVWTFHTTSDGEGGNLHTVSEDA